MPYTERADAIKAIKTALQRRSGKQWSVTGGRGTAWGWLTISVPPSRLGCARRHEWGAGGTICRFCDRSHLDLMDTRDMGKCAAHTPERCDERCYRHYLTPEDGAELAGLLGVDYVHDQGVLVEPGSWDYYMRQAAGDTDDPVCRTPYLRPDDLTVACQLARGHEGYHGRADGNDR